MEPLTTDVFRVIEHVVPCQHISEYPGAKANGQANDLKLAVKQYIPIDNPDPQTGDVTILAAHANGLTKELYEPFWEDLYASSKSQGFNIRAIWMADVSNEGQSGIINEGILGDDPSWFDHSRDLLHLVNVKRSETPQPIIGVGHSLGGIPIANLSYMHPRLLHCLILMEPVIQRERTKLDDHRNLDNSQMATEITKLSLFRRDKWPSRKAAAASFQRNPYFQIWDPRVLKKWIKYGLRDTPTAVYPLDNEPHDKTDRGDIPVTLTTTRHQEVFNSTRPVWDYSGRSGSHLTHPDLDQSIPKSYRFYRPESARVFAQLAFLRPSVLYIYGSKSGLAFPALTADKLRNTGTAVGGSGGAARGRVKEILLDQVGHLIPLEAPQRCAENVAPWLRSELSRWHSEEKALAARFDRATATEQASSSDQWKELFASRGSRPQGPATWKL
ncbi:uncharacterized protein N7446_003291 [Penicillium canescens]|uniref:AB hydrolase-1 domain-containing protein n=1 Tax=Penicillium canescens TaxID=5083 RepID=A0AAD6IHH8_PENCN|nr:uncharacterized protein N7446_003291 [Penicillium canescens]KAJ6045089.1 hypothetical protein N7460_006444 [Penicillium canescens]KAJ6075514.1 hypothetical protein N7446_003291 [Penicillium canescens]